MKRAASRVRELIAAAPELYVPCCHRAPRRSLPEPRQPGVFTVTADIRSSELATPPPKPTRRDSTSAGYELAAGRGIRPPG